MAMAFAFGPHAPLVDYESLGEFQELSHRVCQQYQLLITKTLHAQAKRHNQTQYTKCRYAWTSAESISLGLAEFPELHELGPQVLLRLTKNRGMRFILKINEQIVLAVTACCRTYFNTLNERCDRHFYKAHPDSPSDIDGLSLRHVASLMGQTLLDVLGPLFCVSQSPMLVHRNSHMTELYSKCFASYAHPVTGEVMCRVPRGRVGEYFVAICSMTHPRLGDRSGAARLCTDVLRIITDMVAFQ